MELETGMKVLVKNGEQLWMEGSPLENGQMYELVKHPDNLEYIKNSVLAFGGDKFCLRLEGSEELISDADGILVWVDLQDFDDENDIKLVENNDGR